MIKNYFEHEAARFMRHPLFWSIAIAGYLLALGYDAYRSKKDAYEFELLKEAIIRNADSQ